MKRKWTLQQWTQAKQLLMAGMRPFRVAAIVGMTPQQVRDKWRDCKRSAEQRESRNEAARFRRAWSKNKYVGKPRVYLARSNTVSRPTHDMLIERDRRLAILPRDLTAALCGDPLPGYSALERRA